MIKRLRPLPAINDLAKIYAKPHNHRIYGRGHHLRVEITKILAQSYAKNAKSVADLSCGNAAIAKSLELGLTVLGDYAPGYQLTGPIEQTIDQIHPVDIFICSETIEHLNDPGDVLKKIRKKANSLVISTPLECWNDGNGEHLWAWNREDVEGLLKAAEWKPAAFASLDSRVFQEPYLYGIWVCE